MILLPSLLSKEERPPRGTGVTPRDLDWVSREMQRISNEFTRLNVAVTSIENAVRCRRHNLLMLFALMCSFLLMIGSLSLAVVETSARKLLNELFPKDYDVDARPGPDDGPLVVTVTPNKLILLAMDQQQETIQFSEEFLLSWTDPGLSWDRTRTPYTRDWIKIAETSVWTPDIIFTSAMDRQEIIATEDRMADLRFDGSVRISNPSIIYDVIVKSSADTIEVEVDTFEGNSEWELLSIRAVEEVQVYPDRNESYSAVIYQVKLKRKPVYYVLVIQAPTFIMSTLAIFGIFSPFSNTQERREKVTLGLNMFVSVSMMLNLVSDMMPKASRLPLLGNYILSEVFVTSAALIVSMVILVTHERCHTRRIRPPPWVVRVFLCQCSTQRVIDEELVNPPPPYSTSDNTPAVQIFQQSEFIEALEQATAVLRTTIDRLRREDDVRLTWIRVFDHIDLVCLITFQTLNISCSLLFMR